MQCTTILPAGYTPWKTIDFQQDQSLMVALGLASILAFIGFGFLFLFLAFSLSPFFSKNFRLVVNFQILGIAVLSIVIVSIAVVIVHEAIHGLFFWLFTRKPPVFGFRWVYAYAAAPEYYIPRNQFLVVGIAPLVLISLVGLALFLVTPFAATIILVLALTLNASGAVGDLYVVGWLLARPASVLIRDFGDGMTVYGLP
ncbi:MAG TPA: DUF3267 domain-containing protein [Ktedonobacteraceae bacterium]